MSTDISHRPLSTAQTWSAGLGDTVLLRINPVPGVRLGSAELRIALGTLVDAQLRKERLREAACDELYVVAAQVTGKDRHQALTLKRAIYNDRDPGTAPGISTWPAAVTGWLTEQRRAQAAEAPIRAGHHRFLAAERLTLADTLGDDALQLALALNAPQVLDAVERYRRTGGVPGTRERKSERGLLQYLTRAMVRTSPLSWLPAVGFATWSADGVPLDAPVFDRDDARASVTVDRVLFGAAVTGMLEPPAGTVAPVLARNASLRPVATGVRFQRRIGAETHLVETPLSPQMRALLELTALGPIAATVLAEQVAHRLDIDTADGARVVTAAAAAQILVAGPAVDEQAADPLPLARAALGADHPGAALMAAMQREVIAVASGSVPDRRRALTRLGGIQDRINELTTRPARLHLNEDVMLPTATITDRGHQAALHDLADVLELASLFDTNLVMRCLLTTAFTERFGAGGTANLLDCGEALARDVATRARSLTPTWDGPRDTTGGAVATVLEMRERARTALVAEIESARHEDEAWVPAGMFATLAAALPERLRRRPASYGVLVQPVDGRLVVNGCYGGHNLLGMRFLGAADADIRERVARRARRLFGDDGTRLVEDHGLHGSNVNHRDRLLSDVIDPAGWLDVRLAHDRDRDELLLLDADGAPIRVLYFGMRWIETLPPPLRIAMWLADTSQLAFDPTGWARRAALRAGRDTASQRYPRLVAGAVVLGRRRWYPGDDFPPAGTATDEAGQLVGVARWRAAHGVPEEIVVKTVPEPAADIDPAAAMAWYQRVHRRGKPQYVDLASALMVRVLPQLLERRGAGFIEEALPGVRDGRHAFEWVVEYDRPAGGRFRADRP